MKTSLLNSIKTNLNFGSSDRDKEEADRYMAVQNHLNDPENFNMPPTPQQPKGIKAAIGTSLKSLMGIKSESNPVGKVGEESAMIQSVYGTPQMRARPFYGNTSPAPIAAKNREPEVKGAVSGPRKQPQGYEFLEGTIFPLTRNAGIPDALAASQWAVEGGRVTENPQNNPWGLMRDGKLIQYPSIEASTNDYILTVKNILKAKGYDDVSDLEALKVLQILQQGDRPRYEGHNPDPNTYVDLISNTPEWRYYN